MKNKKMIATTMTMTMTMTSHPTNYRREQGFTLVEALIALLVLSIGLLGVAGMQLKALQSAHMAYQRSLASVIAVDAQERVWASRASGACPDNSEIEDISNDWVDFWLDEDDNGLETLPNVGDSEITWLGNCSYAITVDWSEERMSEEESEVEDASSFTYQFSLPGSTT